MALYPPRKDPIAEIVVERHSVKRSHQRRRKYKCDLHGCKINPNAIVARALSREFTVDTKGNVLVSQVVLAEVRVKDYKTKQTARNAVRRKAKRKQNLTLDVLNKIKRPLECGYTEEEVFHAILPYIMRHARVYSNNHFPLEDAINQGWCGIRSALETDRAMAPFATHAYLHIRTKIRRPIYESGLIRHGEREGDYRGAKGGRLGFEWTCHDCGEVTSEEPEFREVFVKKGGKIVILKDGKKKTRKIHRCIICNREEVTEQKNYGSLTSADAELGDSFALKDAMECADPGPLEVVMERDMAEHKRQIIADIKEEAGLSDQQLETMVLLFGLDGNKEHSGTEVSKKLGNSRQRVGQQRKKCLEKLRAAAETLGYDLDLIEGL